MLGVRRNTVCTLFVLHFHEASPLPQCNNNNDHIALHSLRTQHQPLAVADVVRAPQQHEAHPHQEQCCQPHPAHAQQPAAIKQRAPSATAKASNPGQDTETTGLRVLSTTVPLGRNGNSSASNAAWKTAYPMQSVFGEAISNIVWPRAALPAAMSTGACTTAHGQGHCQ